MSNTKAWYRDNFLDFELEMYKQFRIFCDFSVAASMNDSADACACILKRRAA